MIKLYKIRKQFKRNTVLHSISFEVQRGDFKTIIGKIGSGKSTIINLICGLLKPDSGQIYFEDKLIKPADRTYIQKIGFLLSVNYLIEDFSTILYWKSIGKLLNLKRDYIENRISYLLNLFNISDPNLDIGYLSSGNQMLTKIGAMLLSSPEILIIDEPFIHLDMKEVSKIENILKTFNENGITILMATHYSEPRRIEIGLTFNHIFYFGI